MPTCIDFGHGPNWRLRTTRAALDALGFKDDMLRHGIQRQVFLCLLAENAKHILKTGKGRPDVKTLLTAADVAERAVSRWIIPRSRRRTEYLQWTPDSLFDLFGSQSRMMRSRVLKSG